MATYLASIFGTEQDKVNCSFHQKIGACRHGTRCGRKHIRPLFSPTILISNAYRNSRYAATFPSDGPADGQALQDRFDQFYADWYVELSKYGHLLELHVCDNVEDHLLGNLYARFEWEDEAQRALEALNGRWYDGRPVFVELSPVTDFREACCRSFEMGVCTRAGQCNFLHLMRPTPSVVHQLTLEAAEEAHERRRGQKELYTALDTCSPAHVPPPDKTIKGQAADDDTQMTEAGEAETEGPVRVGWKDRIERFSGPREQEAEQPFAPLPEDALWRQGPSGGDWTSDSSRALPDAAAALVA